MKKANLQESAGWLFFVRCEPQQKSKIETRSSEKLGSGLWKLGSGKIEKVSDPKYFTVSRI
jgi:hypothetical protein